MKLPKINSKADAMAYAIEKADGDLERAEKIYRLFADNMELPDTETMGKGSVFGALASRVLPTFLDIKGESEQEIPVSGI